MPAKAKLTTRERTTSNVSSDNLNKGSELSFAEADSNFFNLRDQTFAISDGTTSTDIEAGETITFSGASVSGNTVSITGGGGDLGNLQVNGTTLSPVSTNDSLTLTANGSGRVIANAIGIDLEGPVRLGTAGLDGDIRNYSNGRRLLIGSIQGQTGAMTQYQSDGSMRTILADTTKAFNLYTQSDPTGALEIKTPSTGPVIQPEGTLGTNSPSNQNITINPLGTGQIVLDGLNWPTADGTNGQVLTTDGAGNLSFATGTQGNITISDFNTATIIDTGDYAAAQTENDTTILTSGATQDAIERQKLLVYAGNTSPGNTTLSVDRDTASIVRDTLDTNITVGSIQNFEAGQSIVFIFTQDGTGNRTVTWTDTIKWLGGSSTLSTGANKVDKVTLINDGQVILGELNKDYS
jgi:hypothetical protein